jgi:hypothetical protein
LPVTAKLRRQALKRIHRLFDKSRDQEGTVLLIAVGSIVLLLGFAALALDIGHLLVVRNELQNAADAAALSGASYLYPQTPPSSPAPPEWDMATTQATSAIGLNKSDGVMLANGTVQTGYWDIASPPSEPLYTLKDTGITPGATDCPAVQVTVTKNTQNFFAPLIGIRTSSVGVKATAVMASPGTAHSGSLLPVAITREVAEQKSSFTCPSPLFRIGSSYHYPSVEAGQWTSFFLDRNDVPTIRDLIDNGNPDPVSIGDYIWIEPGTKTTLYSSIPIGADVLLPVVENIVTHAEVPVIGFICFHITDSVGKNKKYIEGCFNDTCYAGMTSGIGPNFGPKAPPRLVQ